jgi:hypothetical protein
VAQGEELFFFPYGGLLALLSGDFFYAPCAVVGPGSVGCLHGLCQAPDGATNTYLMYLIRRPLCFHRGRVKALLHCKGRHCFTYIELYASVLVIGRKDGGLEMINIPLRGRQRRLFAGRGKGSVLTWW